MYRLRSACIANQPRVSESDMTEVTVTGDQAAPALASAGGEFRRRRALSRCRSNTCACIRLRPKYRATGRARACWCSARSRSASVRSSRSGNTRCGWYSMTGTIPGCTPGNTCMSWGRTRAQMGRVPAARGAVGPCAQRLVVITEQAPTGNEHLPLKRKAGRCARPNLHKTPTRLGPIRALNRGAIVVEVH